MKRAFCFLRLALVFVVVIRMSLYAPQRLQSCYVQVLQSYVGTPYVWGGESQAGIDCSGLVRAAFVEAAWRTGKSYWRPDLIWWHYKVRSRDFRARDILNDRRRFAFVKHFANLNAADLHDLQPGDLAVLAQGTHVMAYLGDGEWIEANGAQDKVIRVRLPAEKSLAHYAKPVLIYRWKTFL